MIVTMTDIRSTGYCAAGIRRWCDLNGVDFRALVRDGISDDALRATGDSLVDKAIEAAQRRIDGNG